MDKVYDRDTVISFDAPELVSKNDGNDIMVQRKRSKLSLKGKKSLSKIAKDLDKSVFTVMLAILARNAKAMLKR